MNKNNIIYWVTTGLFGAMMLFSGYSYFANPEVGAMFAKTGFPDFFRTELGAAKIIGALALLIPQVPARVKEWAYVGFGILLLSASYTHFSLGDPAQNIITPLVFLVVLAVSNIYLNKDRA
jgi:DoxX-like family